MNLTIETEIEINAPAEVVWKILLDTSQYASWNPFLQPVQGEFEKGKAISVTLNPPGGGMFKFRPVVTRSEFPEIAWLGKVLFKGIFDGEHYFRLEPLTASKTKFVHGENFSGILVGFLGRTFEKTRAGFVLMNEALKMQAER